MTRHTVTSTSDTVRSGFLDPTAAAVATVASGDVVAYPDTWTHWGNEAKFGMNFADREPLRHRYPHGPYAMVGPVVVAGTQPGDAVEIRIERLDTIGWGWNSFPLGVGALPHDFDEPYLHYFRFNPADGDASFDNGIRVPIRPLVGVAALEQAGDDPISAILAGPTGGNLVLRDFTQGASLFLPVAKPGARLWIGDIHAAEGDGVVDQTGIESAAQLLELRLTRHVQVPLDGPLLDTDQAWILIGFADNLDDALVACLRRCIAWLNAAAGIDKSQAYALASLAVSFRITQYSNQTGSAYDSIPPKAVHAVIPKTSFPPPLRQRIEQWLRPSAAQTDPS